MNTLGFGAVFHAESPNWRIRRQRMSVWRFDERNALKLLSVKISARWSLNDACSACPTRNKAAQRSSSLSASAKNQTLKQDYFIF